MRANNLSLREELHTRWSFFRSIGRLLMSVLDGFNLLLFGVLIALATMQVLLRYVFVIPLPWTEELARFTLVWVTFLGAASVTQRKLHIKVDWLTSKFPPRLDHWVATGVYLLIFFLLVSLLWGSLVMMEDSWPVFAGSLPWLSIAYLYLGAVIGVSIMLLCVVLQLGREIRVAFSLF